MQGWVVLLAIVLVAATCGLYRLVRRLGAAS